jgi:hypothetical protein
MVDEVTPRAGGLRGHLLEGDRIGDARVGVPVREYEQRRAALGLRPVGLLQPPQVARREVRRTSGVDRGDGVLGGLPADVADPLRGDHHVRLVVEGDQAEPVVLVESVHQ